MKMRAAVLTEPRRVVCREMPAPPPGPGEVQIRTVWCGICGSELHAYHGLHKKRIPPVVMGHEVSGVVCAVNETVRRLKPGDRVTVVPMYGCGHCPECLRGETSLCAQKIILGSPQWPGAFGEYFTAPESVVLKLPPEVTMERAALIEPLAVGLHAVRTAGIRPGDRVAVLGAGAIGLSALLMAKQAGAALLLATDILPFHLQLAQKLGATHTADARDEQALSASMDACGADGGFDAVIVAAPVPSLVEQAVRLTRKQGKILLAAMFDHPVPLDVEALRGGERWFSGTSMYFESDFERVIRLLQGGLDPSPLVTHRMALSEAPEAFALLDGHTPDAVKILMRAGTEIGT